MANRCSALAAYYPTGLHGRPGEPGVKLQEIPGLNLWQIAGWPDTITEGMNSNRLSPGRALAGPKGVAFQVEPLKFWLLAEAPPVFNQTDGVVLDLSHSRTQIRVSGPEAQTCLSRLLPLDLRDHSFPQNAVASSGIHHVGITLWRSELGFELFIPRGFARSIWELLLETAEQFGSEVI
jgi:heterotetrameric sarcosine oxidase gamma subunit